MVKKMFIVFEFTHELRTTGESTSALPVAFLTSYCKLCRPVKIGGKEISRMAIALNSTEVSYRV